MPKQLEHKSGVKVALTALIVALMFAYPFLIYFFIDEISPRWFILVLLFAFLARFLLSPKDKRLGDYLMLTVVSIFCACVMLFESDTLLTFYPVLVNISMGLLFISSLNSEQNLIERFARAMGETPPSEAKNYLRVLCWLWGILLIANGAISAYTAWYTSLSVWTFYNGFLSYVLIASFALSEWLYRGHYKRKHGIIDD